jgi:RNA polymerase sigma-70 factor (sigma-E family)
MAFDELYRSAHRPMVRLAWLLVGSRAVAEEVVHDSFLVVHERWSSIDEPAAYLRRVVANDAISWRRRHQREGELLSLVGEPPPTGDVAVDHMWDAVERLRPERRAVVVLRYWADLPHAEIAALLGCPVATVRSRLHRALSDLRREVER